MFRFSSLSAIVLLLLACALAAQGASTVGITVPEAGDHYYWFGYTDVDGKPAVTVPRVFRDKSTTADLPLVKDAVPKGNLYVLDASTGNEAVRPLVGKPDEARKVELKAADFDRVRRVLVEVVSSAKGEPIASGVVKLDDPESGMMVRMLDPSSRGIAEFTNVSAGTVKVVVQYGDAKSTSQDVDIPLDRKEAVPRIKVPVVGEVETVAPIDEGVSETPVESEQRGREEGTRMDFPTALMGFILFVLIMYVAYRIFASRGGSARGLFKKMGVDLPESEQAGGAPAGDTGQQVESGFCPFCGGKKDPVTGACACSTDAGGPAGTAPAAEGPRFIASQGPHAGSIYMLQAAGTTIGREVSNTIALTGDSTASRKHASVTLVNNEWRIRDEGSSNGTFVNGAKVSEQVLRAGDEIQVGSTKLRFEP